MFGPELSVSIAKAMLGASSLAILLEGASLSGIKSLANTKKTASKITKCALAALAFIAGIFVTLGITFSAPIVLAHFCPSIMVIPPSIALAATAIPIVYAQIKAFRWALLTP